MINNNAYTWKVSDRHQYDDYKGDIKEYKMVYYLLLQKNGDLLLAQGTEVDNSILVRFIYKLEEEVTNKNV